MKGWESEPEWDKNSCIEAVEQYIALLRRLPKLDEEGANHLPARQVFELEVGVTYQKYCDIVHPELSQIGHSPPSKLTAEDIFKLTDAFYEKHHRRPKAGEYRAHNHLPSHNTILAATGLTAGKFWDKFYPDTIEPSKASGVRRSIPKEASDGDERQEDGRTEERHLSTVTKFRTARNPILKLVRELRQRTGGACEVGIGPWGIQTHNNPSAKVGAIIVVVGVTPGFCGEESLPPECTKYIAEVAPINNDPGSDHYGEYVDHGTLQQLCIDSDDATRVAAEALLEFSGMSIPVSRQEYDEVFDAMYKIMCTEWQEPEQSDSEMLGMGGMTL